MKSVHRMVFAIGVLAAIRAASVVAAEVSAESPLHSIAVQVQPAQKPPRTLCFTITNPSPHDLTFDRADLPWISCLTVKASRVDSLKRPTAELTRKLRISDPPAGTVRVASHTSITGTLQLARCF